MNRTRDFQDGDAEWEVADIDWDKPPTAEEMEAILAEKRERADMLEELYAIIGG